MIVTVEMRQLWQVANVTVVTFLNVITKNIKTTTISLKQMCLKFFADSTSETEVTLFLSRNATEELRLK